MTKNTLDQYRPIFTKENLVRVIQNGPETIYLYQGLGLVPDTRTDKYIDYTPTRELDLLSGYTSATQSPFCSGCMLYKYPDEQISLIANQQKQVMRITESLLPANESWGYLVLIFIIPLLTWLILKIIRKRNRT